MATQEGGDSYIEPTQSHPEPEPFLHKDIRNLIYERLFDDVELCAVSEESSGEVVLYPYSIYHSDKCDGDQPQTPGSYLAITMVNKDIREESLKILWSKLARLRTNLPPRSSLTIPSHYLHKIRVLEVDHESCRRSSQLRPDDMKNLSTIFMSPYLGQTETRFGNIDMSLGDDWDRFIGNFVWRNTRTTRNCIVDHFLANTLAGNGRSASIVRPLHSTYKVLFSRQVFAKLGGQMYKAGSNNCRRPRSSSDLLYQYYDISIRKRVDVEDCICSNGGCPCEVCWYYRDQREAKSRPQGQGRAEPFAHNKRCLKEMGIGA